MTIERFHRRGDNRCARRAWRNKRGCYELVAQVPVPLRSLSDAAMKQEVVKRAGGDTVGEAQSGGGGAGEGWERAGGSAWEGC